MNSAVSARKAPARPAARHGLAALSRDGAGQQAPAQNKAKPEPATDTPEAKLANQAAKAVGARRDSNPARDQIRARLMEAADRHGIPHEILMAIAFKESNWRHYARDGSVLRGRWSPTDVGIMQINEHAHPQAFPRARVDMRYNIEYGARFLKWQFERYGNWPDAIAAYNYGSARRKKSGKLVNQYYLDKVNLYANHFKAHPDGLPIF